MCLIWAPWLEDIVMGIQFTTQLTNKQRRFKCYRNITRALQNFEEPLNGDPRVVLPICVKGYVRNLFPDGEYTGHRKSE